MVFRVLNSLENAGWVYCENPNEKKYHLTLRPFQMTRKAVDRLSINTAATPFVHQLWKRSGQSTYLGILKEDKVLYIQHFDGIGDLKVAGSLGGLYDLYMHAEYGDDIIATAMEISKCCGMISYPLLQQNIQK